MSSLPDYPADAPQHQIKKRHVGWDGALEGYTLADGSYVGVKVGREGGREGGRRRLLTTRWML